MKKLILLPVWLLLKISRPILPDSHQFKAELPALGDPYWTQHAYTMGFILWVCLGGILFGSCYLYKIL